MILISIFWDWAVTEDAEDNDKVYSDDAKFYIVIFEMTRTVAFNSA